MYGDCEKTPAHWVLVTVVATAGRHSGGQHSKMSTLIARKLKQPDSPRNK